MEPNMTSKGITHRFDRCVEHKDYGDDHHTTATFFAFVHSVLWSEGEFLDYSDGSIVVHFGPFTISRNRNEYTVTRYGHSFIFNYVEADH